MTLVPFSNGEGFGSGRADARKIEPGRWQVFLYLEGGVRSYKVEAREAKAAIAAAWHLLKKERDEEEKRRRRGF